MNWLKTMILLLVVSQVILINGCAKKVRKQDSPFDKKAVFNTIDKSHDGKIGKKEYQVIWKDKEMAEEYFNRLDKDNDGFLTEDEFMVPWVTIPLR